MIKFNPHIKFFDGDRRGHLQCQLDRAQLRADLQVVPTVSRPDAP
jgi:alkaline phosphatase D